MRVPRRTARAGCAAMQLSAELYSQIIKDLVSDGLTGCGHQGGAHPLDQAIELINDAEQILEGAESFFGPAQGIHV